MKSFDRAAVTYDSHAIVQREMAAWLAEWLPAERIGTAIEVAAGTGLFTHHLQLWNGQLLATDASEAMVAGGSAKHPQAAWSVAAANQLPNVSANWIFSSSFLQWANEPVALLRHWKDRLGANGRILAGLFVAPTLTELADVLPNALPLRWRSSEEWEAAIGAAGLALIRAETSERVFAFPSALHLLRALHGIGAAPARRVSGASLREAIRRYDRRFGTEGGVRSTWTFYRFEARK